MEQLWEDAFNMLKFVTLDQVIVQSEFLFRKTGENISDREMKKIYFQD